MCPLRKSLTNWQFSARSWASLVPSASISDKSLGLDGSGNAHDKTHIFLGDEENNTLTTRFLFLPENFILTIINNHSVCFLFGVHPFG